MANTTVYLIRHGEIDNPSGKFYGRKVDVPLSQHGREQLANMGRTITGRDDRLEVLVASPMRRAQQSAQILSEQFSNIPVMTDERFLESDATGFDDWLVSDIVAFVDSYASPPSGVVMEDREKMASRMIEGIKNILQEYSGKTVGIVSHGDPIAYAMWRLTHPSESFAVRRELVKQYDPLKGNGWRLEFDESGKLLKSEKVLSDEGNILKNVNTE
jgi:broad specificity phosphatase PhoE